MLPKGILQNITKAMRNFWWSASKERHKILWIAWNKITQPKSEGKLGIRDLIDFNLAVISKQTWRH